jgi:hypothetical protein
MAQIYISNELLDNDLIIPFCSDSSLQIAASDLQERLSWIASIEPSDLVDTLYEAPFSYLQQSRTTNSEFSSMSTAIIGQHKMTTSIAKSVGNQAFTTMDGFPISEMEPDIEPAAPAK